MNHQVLVLSTGSLDQLRQRGERLLEHFVVKIDRLHAHRSHQLRDGFKNVEVIRCIVLVATIVLEIGKVVFAEELQA